VVWVANTNDPIIGSSGFLFINQYGNLVLHGKDDQKLPVWSPNVSVEENDFQYAANNTRKSNVFLEKTMVAILVPSIASLWFLISLSAYLWLKKRAKQDKTRLSNLYLLCRPKSRVYPALVVGRSSLFASCPYRHDHRQKSSVEKTVMDDL